MNQDADNALVLLRRRVDEHFVQAQRRSPRAFQCRRGCDGCCHRRFGVFAIEAARVRAALRSLARRDPAVRRRVREQADASAHADRCPMLVDGACAVYDERPLICRSHGLPVKHGPGAIDWCPLNFTDTSPPAASVLDLEAVNRPLAVMATMFDGAGERIALAQLARED